MSSKSGAAKHGASADLMESELVTNYIALGIDLDGIRAEVIKSQGGADLAEALTHSQCISSACWHTEAMKTRGDFAVMNVRLWNICLK